MIENDLKNGLYLILRKQILQLSIPKLDIEKSIKIQSNLDVVLCQKLYKDQLIIGDSFGYISIFKDLVVAEKYQLTTFPITSIVLINENIFFGSTLGDIIVLDLKKKQEAYRITQAQKLKKKVKFLGQLSENLMLCQRDEEQSF